MNFGPDSDSVIQRFVHSKEGRASYIRLFYTSGVKGCTNYAFFVTNKCSYQDSQLPLQQSASHCYDDEYSFDSHVMKGRALNELEEYAALLVTFICRSYGLKMQKSVFDFIKDEQGTPRERAVRRLLVGQLQGLHRRQLRVRARAPLAP